MNGRFDKITIPELSLLQEKGIVPLYREEIEELLEKSEEHQEELDYFAYDRERGINKLLQPPENYASLPSLRVEGRGLIPAKEIIKRLPPDSCVLDVGCGRGNLGAEILVDLNPQIKYYGCDVQHQAFGNDKDASDLPGQERLTGMFLTGVDRLTPAETEGMKFDLIVSSAMLYHLDDPWGAVLRMGNMLDEQGIMLTSTFVEGFNALGGVSESPNYHRVYDTHGNIIPPSETVDILRKSNPNFYLQHSLPDNHNIGITMVGGQISGYRKGEDTLDLSNLFYCLQGNYGESLGYIIAQTDEEKEALYQAGYVNVQERYDKQLENTALVVREV